VVADYVLRAEGLLDHAKRALAAGVDADRGMLTVAASAVRATYLLAGELTQGAGVTAISRMALDTEFKAGVLAVLDVPAWRQAHNVTLMTVRDVPLTPPAAAFVDAVRRAICPSAPSAGTTS
jgi:DNA-binding transcriptional LysR family regulator